MDIVLTCEIDYYVDILLNISIISLQFKSIIKIINDQLFTDNITLVEI